MELITPGLGLIFWQIVIFLMLVFVLAKYAWKPILKAIGDRDSAIEDALTSAEQAKEEMAKLKSDNEKLLADARAERDQMLKEALTAANTIKEEAKTDAGKISNKMIEDAKAAINTEKKAALAEVKDQVASLSVQIAEKLLKKNLDNEPAQKELVADLVKDIRIN
ncbi:MAG: F0F1 ATP synthase subunit B [Cyclobacteriaceae bacterium]